MLRVLTAPVATALLTALCVVQPIPAAAAVERDWGWTQGSSAVLKKGCQRYTYRYELTLPTDDWAVEIFIVDPRGRRVASDYLLSDHEATTDKRWFRLCGVSTRPGRFKIQAKVAAHDGWDEIRGRLPRSTFRLRKG